jgi:hypothetical protein
LIEKHPLRNNHGKPGRAANPGRKDQTMLNKKELAAIQDVTSMYDNYVQMQNEAFETLQLELKQRCFNPSQCLESNAEALASIGGPEGIKRALYLYRKYSMADAYLSQIRHLASNLANATGKNFPLGTPKG